GADPRHTGPERPRGVRATQSHDSAAPARQRGRQRQCLRVPAEPGGLLHQWRDPARGWRRDRRGVTLMSRPIPEFDTDLFSHESVRNANAVDDRLRELAPVVRLPGEDVVMLARFEHVSTGLKDWRSFSSTSRPWHDPASVRPELLLTDDPPKHTRVRAVI